MVDVAGGWFVTLTLPEVSPGARFRQHVLDFPARESAIAFIVITSVSARRALTGAQIAAALARAPGRNGARMMCRPGGAASYDRVPRILATCPSSRVTSMLSSAARAIRTSPAPSTRRSRAALCSLPGTRAASRLSSNGAATNAPRRFRSVCPCSAGYRNGSGSPAHKDGPPDQKLTVCPTETFRSTREMDP
jgi:hypothetical protein